MDEDPLARAAAAISAAMRERSDEMVLKQLGATASPPWGTTTNAPASPALTIDALQKAVAAMPPRLTLLQSRLFPDTNVIRVDGRREQFWLGGAGVWRRWRDQLRATFEARAGNPWAADVTPRDIDADEADTAMLAEWKRGEWERLRKAVDDAFDVPEWLRAGRQE